jgi:hypothetical protein
LQDPDEEIAKIDKTVKSEDSSQVGLLPTGYSASWVPGFLSSNFPKTELQATWLNL